MNLPVVIPLDRNGRTTGICVLVFVRRSCTGFLPTVPTMSTSETHRPISSPGMSNWDHICFTDWPPGAVQEHSRCGFVSVGWSCLSPRLDGLPHFNRPKTGTPAIILIGKGVYHETVNVTRVSPLTLLVIGMDYVVTRICAHVFYQGQLDQTSINPVTNIYSRNLVQIWDNRYVKNGLSNAQTAVLVVQPSSGTVFTCPVETLLR